MSPQVQIVVLLLHLLAMLFMAAPLYALLSVGERGRFTIPPNYNTDRYLEYRLKCHPLRCFPYPSFLPANGV